MQLPHWPRPDLLAGCLAVSLCVGRDPKKAGPEAMAWLSAYLKDFQDALEAPDWLRHASLCACQCLPHACRPACLLSLCCCLPLPAACALPGARLDRRLVALPPAGCTAHATHRQSPAPLLATPLPACLQPLPLLHLPHRRPLLGRLLPAHRGHQEPRWLPVRGRRRACARACLLGWGTECTSGTASCRLYVDLPAASTPPATPSS